MSRFSELFSAHLTNGTRPTGPRAARWTVPEFATAVGIEERTVRNWRNGAARANDLGRIETALFGDNPAHDDARAELRAAFDGRPYQAKTEGAPVQSVAASKPANLPYPTLGSLFTGRADYLKLLRENLLAGHPTAINGKAIHGLGGVGKTRAAVEYAHAHQADYTATLFAVAETREGLRTNVAALAGVLGLENFVSATDDQRLAHALGWLSGNPGWLLILDNVDTPEALAAVTALLGQLRAGHVLLTSRLDNFPGHFSPLALDVLAAEDATDFLLARTDSRRAKTPADAADARALAVDDLGQLALALEQAAAYISRHRLSFAAYRTIWAGASGAAQAYIDPAVMNYPRSLATTFHISINRVSAPARALLERCAFLAPDPIPEFLLEVPVAAGAEEENKAGVDGPPSRTKTGVDGPLPGPEALVELTDYSLASRASEAFTIHRVVQDTTRRALGPDTARLHEALRWVNAAFTGDPQDVRTWPRLDPLAPHAAAIAAQADSAGISDPTARLMGELDTLMHAKARYTEAERYSRRALAIDEARLGPDHPNVAIRLNNLASLLRATNRLAEAEKLFLRVVEIIEKGTDQSNLGVALNNLAGLLQATNRLAEAEPLFLRALAIDEASFGPDHPDVARDLNNFALLLQDTNRLAEAEKLFRRALAITEASLGPDHPDVTTSLNNLASLLQATNRLAEAEPMFRRALAIDEAGFGPEHPNVANCLNNLAGLLQDTNRLAEAERLYARGLRILIAFRRATTHEHPNFQTVRGNYVGALRELGRGEAEIAAALDAVERGE